MLANRIKARLRAMALLCGGVFSLVSPASADTRQLWPRDEVEIPFAFRVGHHSLPAGPYRLEPLTPGSPSYYLKNVKTRKSLMVMGRSGQEPRPTQLTFDKDETGYVLRQVK